MSTATVERLVKQEGLEGALLKLLRAGVYLTVDEYKGRRPAVRGNTTIAADPRLLRNPLAVPQFCATTSGSLGAPTAIPLSLCLYSGSCRKHVPVARRPAAAQAGGMPCGGCLESARFSLVLRIRCPRSSLVHEG